MSRAHARLAPSAAHRWMRCLGSIGLEAGEDDESSIFAAEGTCFHEFAAEALSMGWDAHHVLGHKITKDGFTLEMTEEVVGHLQPGLDRIREFPGKLYVEQRVDLHEWAPESFGTSDVTVYDEVGREIVVWDWKYGMGVVVSPVENEQLMLYALGVWAKLGRPAGVRFRLIICQPRVAGGGGEPWIIELKELLAFGERVKSAAAATLRKNAPLTAGEKQCRFCKVKGQCSEFARFNLDLVSMQFDDVLDTPPSLPATITPERRSYIIQHSPMLREFLDMLHAEALADALAGRPTPGLKAVHGRRPARKWHDEDVVEKYLTAKGVEHAKMFDYSLISPTQAEKKMKSLWDDLDGFVTQGDPKPVLATVDDERPALCSSIDQFDEVMET